MDPQSSGYLQYYRSQQGGQLQAFRGARFAPTQGGNGLGDILRGIFRAVFPIAARGASTFLTEAVNAQASGKGWKEAARSAIAPTIGTVARSALEEASAAAQSGTGKHRGKSRKRLLMAPDMTDDQQAGAGHRRKRQRKSSRARASTVVAMGTRRRGRGRRAAATAAAAALLPPLGQQSGSGQRRRRPTSVSTRRRGKQQSNARHRRGKGTYKRRKPALSGQAHKIKFLNF